jgi:hypothetical protein
MAIMILGQSVFETLPYMNNATAKGRRDFAFEFAAMSTDRHREERSDEAIQGPRDVALDGFPPDQGRGSLAMTAPPSRELL